MTAKYFALALALAISTPALAAPVSDTQTATSAIFEADWTFSVIKDNVYKVDLGLFSAFTSAKGSSSVTATIYDAFDKLVTTVSGNTNITNSTFSNWVEFTALSSGTYSLEWAGSSNRGTTTATATVSNVTPVPGPEAGAGLGALALGGMALYANRRRKENASVA